jgi:hypothetical protein
VREKEDSMREIVGEREDENEIDNSREKVG